MPSQESGPRPATTEASPVAPPERVCGRCGGAQPACGHFDCRSCHSARPVSTLCAGCGLCTFNACCTCQRCLQCARSWPRTAETMAADPICSQCGCCADRCCACPECDECGERTREDRLDDDGICRRCSGNVRINSYGSLRANFDLEFHEGRPCLRNPSRRFLGVEIEVAGTHSRIRRTQEYVKRHRITVGEDGSLPSGGFEIRVPPASGDVFVARMEGLLAALAADGGYVDHSCGLHVHVDARDFSDFCLRKIGLMWEAVEQGVLDMFPAERYRESGYCYPVRDRLTRQYKTNALAKGSVMRDAHNMVKTVLHTQHRYSTLNVSSLAKYGTVEVRVHDGTLDPDRIIPWSALCAGIVEQAYRMPEREIGRLAELTPYEALLRVAPTQETRDYVEDSWAKHATARVSVGRTAAEAIGRFPVLEVAPERQTAVFCALCQRYHTEHVGRDFATRADAVDAGYRVETVSPQASA